MSMAIKAAKFQGDPGLFGFLGSAAKKLAGAAISTFVPGPVRTVGRAAIGAVTSRLRPSPLPFNVPSRSGGFGGGAAVRRLTAGPARPGIGTPVTRVPGVRGLAQRLLPGGATGFETVAQGGAGIVPKGFHLNKTGYFLSSPEEFGTFVEPFSRFVRNRRRNPGNMRAADRAVSRIESAKRMAKRLSRISIRKKC